MRLRQLDEFSGDEVIKIKSNDATCLVKGIKVAEKNKPLVNTKVKQ